MTTEDASDLEPKKKLSLKGRKTGRDSALVEKLKARSRENRPLQPWEQDIAEVEAKRAELAETIDHIEKRLVFGYSEALKESCLEYKKEDLKLQCQITDILVAHQG